MLSEAPGNTVIGDTVERLLGGGTPSRSVAGFWNGPIPWASVKDFSDGRLELSSTQESITEAGLRASAANLIPAGVPIICTRMAVGRVASARMPVAINQDLRALFPSAGTDSRFLLWSVDQLRRRFESIATGSTVKGVRSDELLATELWIPPLPEQRRIAEVLDAADEAIRRSEALLAKLEQVKAGLLHDLLTRGLDKIGRLRDPEAHPEQFQDSVLGRVPREWECVQFGVLIASGPQNGLYKPATAYGVGGTRIVRIDGFYHGVFGDQEALQRVRVTSSELRAYSLAAGDILVNRVNSIDYVGKSCLVPTLREPALFESNVMRLKMAVDRVLPDYAIRAWCYHSRRHLVRRAKSAIAQVSVNQDDVKSCWFPLPPLPEQRRIAAILDAHDARIRAERAQLDKLRQIKKGLMHDLLTGKVRVQVPQEAPAP